MAKKLKILGPYTPDHKGPFCTRDGQSVRIITRSAGGHAFPIVGIINDDDTPDCWTLEGHFLSHSEDTLDLMNAREVIPGEGE
ncbi:hypothetical protein FKW31_03130 [Acetobacter sp. DmW_136]|uniref:hypothetical protein n=1 Tax=Acetobacter sp. DmW_136 TaxID=2591091 RepID=UPI00123B88CA|nr:hypothetical protein [Acetobacter sp. DmW_136]KAA8387652.1 hypothetical protein FKW31_03130 [Acetobacter sp. DmW_136]